MDLQERLTRYLTHSSLTFRDFERMCDLSNGTAARLRATTRKSTFDRIANSCNLNVDWLLTGEGKMLKEAAPGGSGASSIQIASEKDGRENSDSRQPTEFNGHLVPLIPTAALANSLSEYLGPGIRKADCQNIVSPVSGAELAITISGDSMEPKFHDGMVVFLKKINDAAFIPWGNTMVLDTENGAFIKDVYPIAEDDSVIEARSLNPLYPPLLIPKTSIYGIYRVLNAIKFFTTM